jgi:hypothetical protein
VTPYQNEGKEGRMVCDIQIVDGQLVSEDNGVMRKLAKTLGLICGSTPA